KTVKILDRAAAGHPAVTDAETDVKAGKMVRAARLRKARGQQPRDVRPAVRSGSQAHLGHLVEGVIRRLAEHVGFRFSPEFTKEIVHPFHFALDERIAQMLGNS